MKYKAVIFDLDGTLLDTIDDIAETLNFVLRSKKLKEFSVDEYKYFVGKGVDNLIKQVIKKGNFDQSLFDELKAGYYEVYKQQATITTRIYPGVSDLLKSLKGQGLSLNVLSNKPHSQTIEVISYYFGDSTFDLVYGKKTEFLPKPDQASILDILRVLQLNPEEVLYVGDTEVDIQTAKNAKISSVGVLWGFRTANELKTAGADYLVSDPHEIQKIIGV